MFFKAANFVRRSSQHFIPKRGIIDTTKKAFLPQNTPYVGVAIGFTALCFQIAVLYPWHHELSEQFTILEANMKSMTAEYQRLEQKIELLNKSIGQIEKNEGSILAKEEEILSSQLRIQEKIVKIDA